MRRSKRAYTLTWIALVLIVVASVALLLMTYMSRGNPVLGISVRILLWLLILVPSLILFLKASTLDLEQRKRKPRNKTAASSKGASGKPVSADDADQLDIDVVTRKLLRSVDAGKQVQEWGKTLLSGLDDELEIMSGLVYGIGSDNTYHPVASYALPLSEEPYTFREGEGLTGQAVMNRQPVVFSSLPEAFSGVFSGLGQTKSVYLAILPVEQKDRVIAVVEFTGFRYSKEQMEQMLKILSREMTKKLEAGGSKKKE